MGAGMKAVVATKYGLPNVLELQEVDKPTPRNSEVLIRVHASTVASGDVRLRSSTWAPWFWLPARMLWGLTRPRKAIPGNELAGDIESVGRDVTRFAKGDQVYGIMWEVSFGGANAEYKCLPENAAAIKPANMTYEEAAAVPIGALTALVLLRKANVQRGQKILVYGASGSVGTFAVQLAKHFGAEVTAVCSTANVEMVKSLGADKVIDYTKEDFTASDQFYDAIFDAVMKTSFAHCRGSLTRRGVYITVDWPILRALWAAMASSRRIVYGIARRIEDLEFLKDLIEAGEVRTVIDRCYPLAETAEAHTYVEQGHKKGNVVITVGHDDEAERV